MADIDWSDFKVILALSRGGSVAAASRIMGVDSSTVSRRLGAAEESLGAVLVLRGGRDFRFTPEGQTALRVAETMKTSIFAATASIKAAKQSIEGKVKITTVGMFFHFLNPLCAILHKQHPNLHVEIDDTDKMVNLAAGEADIALRFVMPTEPDLIARKAFDLGWGVYASQDYAARYGLPETESELRDHRLILFTESRHHLKGFAWMEQFKTDEERFARVNTNSVALRSVLSGIGIAALPCYEEDQHTNIVRVFPEPFHFQPAYIVYHETTRDTARIRVVVDAMMEYLHNQRKILQGTAQER